MTTRRAAVTLCFDLDEQAFDELQHLMGANEPMDESTGQSVRGWLRRHYGASFPRGQVYGFTACGYSGPAPGEEDGPGSQAKLIEGMDGHMIKRIHPGAYHD